MPDICSSIPPQPTPEPDEEPSHPDHIPEREFPDDPPESENPISQLLIKRGFFSKAYHPSYSRGGENIPIVRKLLSESF